MNCALVGIDCVKGKTACPTSPEQHNNSSSNNLRRRETEARTSQVAGRKFSNVFLFCVSIRVLMKRTSERCVLECAKKVRKRTHQKEEQEEIADRFSREKNNQEARDEAEAENAENILF